MSKSISAIRPVIVNVDDKTGLITETAIALPAFMRGVDRKSIDYKAGVLNALPEGIDAGTRITFKMFKCGIETAIAGIGGRVTFTSFVQSIATLLTASAYGQNLTTHYDRLPPYAEYALKIGMAYMGKTESLSLTKLVDVVTQTVDEVFTLTIPAKKPPKVEKPAQVALPAQVNNTAQVEKPEIDIDRVNRIADVADKRAEDNLHNATKAHIDVIVDAEEKARLEIENKAQNEGVNVFSLIEKMPDQTQALELLRSLAESMGYRLAKIPAKKAA